MGILDGVLGGAVSAVGGLLGTYFTNQQSQSNAQAQMDFQAQQSATQYQRAVKDMTAAGINPMLASQVGGNAAMSGAQGSVQNYAPAVSQSFDSAAKVMQSKLLDAQVQTQQSQSDLNRANSALAVEQAKKVQQDTLTSSASAANLNADSSYKQGLVTYYQQLGDKVLADTSLSNTQKQLVLANIKNAALTGDQIKANTGNIQADTVLKGFQSSESQAKSHLFGILNNGLGEIDKLMPGAINSAADTLGSLYHPSSGVSGSLGKSSVNSALRSPVFLLNQ